MLPLECLECPLASRQRWVGRYSSCRNGGSNYLPVKHLAGRDGHPRQGLEGSGLRPFQGHGLRLITFWRPHSPAAQDGRVGRREGEPAASAPRPLSPDTCASQELCHWIDESVKANGPYDYYEPRDARHIEAKISREYIHVYA